ncbi:MAG: hypothetical protein QHH05_09375 [Syntrophomonadaceae bacterium]|nr:hypothetical protein [Syntrophomonadaceae bacterium]
MAQQTRAFTYWAPRVLSLLFVAFLALFSLDVIEPGMSAGQIALGLLMHNIPALLLLAVVVVAWKRELVGAVAFMLAGLLYVVFVFVARADIPWHLALSWILTITGPAFLTSLLWLLSWNAARKHRPPLP